MSLSQVSRHPGTDFEAVTNSGKPTPPGRNWLSRLFAFTRPDGKPSRAEQIQLLHRMKELESAGNHLEAVTLGEKAIIEDVSAQIHLTLAWNRLLLASQGNEFHAWPALLTALEALETRSLDQPDTAVAVAICRWVLDWFSNPYRMDIRGAGTRLTHDLTGGSGTTKDGPRPDGESAEGTNLDELKALLRAGETVRAGNALLSAVPSTIRYGRDANGVAREVRYLMANVLSPLPGETISETLSGEEYPLPGDYEAQLYDRYLYTAAQVHRQRIRARTRGVPGILISSIPKSASEFLSYTLAETLQSPVVRVTIGDPFLGTVYGKWVAEVCEGGCVTHDHFAASETNLAALRDGGAMGIWILVRDPRAVYWSLQNMESEYDGVPVATRMSHDTTLALVKRLADWIDSWVRAEANGFPVRFVRFRDLTANPTDIMGTILQAEGAERFRTHLQARLRQRGQLCQISSNFRKGDDEAWRKGIPEEWHRAIWDVIPERVRHLLDLCP